MKRKPVSELTLTELRKQKQFLELITFTAAGAMLFLAAIICYNIFQEQQYYMGLLLLSCILSIIPGFIGLNEIKQETLRREQPETKC